MSKGGGLLRSSVIFSAMTLISRVSGLVRDQVYAWQFGASPAMDAFFIAFRIPNFMRRISAEGSFSMAFVPVLAEYKEKQDHAAVKELVDRVAGTLTAALLTMTAVVVLAAPWVMQLFAPGWDPLSEQYRLATQMLQITFPYALFISLASLAGGILNSYEKFAIPALSPVLLNLSMIAAAVCAVPLTQPFNVNPVLALAWGVFFAGILQLAFQLPALAKLGLLPRPRWGGTHQGVRKIMRLMVPTLFGSSVAQVNLLLNTALASFLIVGSVSWLYLTDRLLEFPLGMFGVAIGTVILPHLSKRHAATDTDGYSKGLDWGFRLCLLIGVPACLGLVLCAEALIAALFQYGRLHAHDTEMIRLSLMAQSTAVPAFLLVKVLAPAFYSRQDTKTPVKSAVVSVLVNLASTVLLLLAALYLTDAGQAALAKTGGDPREALGEIPGAHACLAAAIAIAGWTNALQLAWYLRRAKVYRRQPGWGRFLRQIGVASVAMTVVVLSLLWLWQGWTVWPWWERLIKLAVVVGAGGGAYGALLWLQGIRLRDLRGH
ncbi:MULTISPECIES: murein biosynthesis integral membrane protein MurJ [unclassified Lysobacter]|uniref:murein biosynthesis integral membrane protein MurJ n=1 Tax=unclassified Lysobacter TaxID=2635362 RepID=UPI001BE76CD8|nr:MULTISPECIES: murein biosynthesis integral membrane protein MurJ [unclassified Lysobacter]MBT2746165.1 murein biosynthesis integral membrane protein MurJ [Lysobacter sp. ISL-42]MBT2753163.1 murein biosynthesis integral membrane protein MurJ [Lysobacter sp. ISL-50]MBT2776877.1 murein biosynthesis integral membrane protein MurJ [Lysobacter sp. ISL-54]MBT2782376.1 murein biosynthesis integral membrane protein MurJ [Lysobacter sp. ISL-52]